MKKIIIINYQLIKSINFFNFTFDRQDIFIEFV